jgi:hypothetical protein
MEKGDGRAGCTAREARMSGHGQKHATGPGQPDREPKSRKSQQSKRNAQPNQFVIDLARR